MKKIGILDLGTNIDARWWLHTVGLLERKQWVAVTPQVISVWCRQMGHDVHYATYFGVGDPLDKLPRDLDLVFIAAHTHLAPLAYALGKVYRKQGTRTVLGGPHAKAYPRNSLRHFDHVVLECDRALIADLVDGQYDPPGVVTSGIPYADTPTIEERMPEIRASVYLNERPYIFTTIPMLFSSGCPYSCNFCMDWNSRYRPMSKERLAQDLNFSSNRLPGVKLMFYDPNFGIRFDETMSIFETVPPGKRSPYVFECSMSTLRGRERLERLQETNCLAVAPGIESWTEYNNKAGVGRVSGRDKLVRVVQEIQEIHEYVPFIQANFIMGLDSDSGNEPFELTREFMLRTPFLYPNFSIPMAFHGTPLYDEVRRERRLLKTMPFSFYAMPYLTIVLKHYDPVTFFERMAELFALLVSNRMFRLRLAADSPWFAKFVNSLRIHELSEVLSNLREILKQLQRDPQMVKFHLGVTTAVPDFYLRRYNEQLGRYAEMMPLAESGPFLELEDEVQILPDYQRNRHDSIVSPGPNAMRTA